MAPPLRVQILLDSVDRDGYTDCKSWSSSEAPRLRFDNDQLCLAERLDHCDHLYLHDKRPCICLSCQDLVSSPAQEAENKGEKVDHVRSREVCLKKHGDYCFDRQPPFHRFDVSDYDYVSPYHSLEPMSYVLMSPVNMNVTPSLVHINSQYLLNDTTKYLETGEVAVALTSSKPGHLLH